MKQLIQIALFFLVFVACNQKQETLDDSTDSILHLKDEVYVKPSEFRLLEHIEEGWAKLYTDYIHDSLYPTAFFEKDWTPTLPDGISTKDYKIILTVK